jgi:NitT/TauT family transport system permease protein
MAEAAIARRLVATGSRLWHTARTILPRVLFFVVLVVAWEAVVRLSGIRSYLLPAPSGVWDALVVAAPHLWRHTFLTVAEALAGFALAAAVGVLMAMLIVYSAYLRSVLLPSLVAFNAAPKVALAPLMVIWLGLGIESKVAMAFLLSFFPIVVNSATGMAEVEPELINLFRLMHASELQTFLQVRLPHSLPALFDGLKIALPIALIGAVVGEFVGAREGLGYLILLAGGNMNTEMVFASVIVIAVISIVLFEVLVAVERALLKWRPSARKS